MPISLYRSGMMAVCAFVCSSSFAYEPLRWTDGKPVLQGFWTNSSITDLERPDHIHKLVLSEQEAQAMAAADPLANRVIEDAKPTAPDAGLLDGSDLLAGRGYNTFWIDPGMQVGKVKGEYRSSWIVEPSDGKIPWSRNGRDYVRRAAERRDNFDGPEVRPLGERCLATTGRTGPPMINGLYNNHYQIVQTPDHVLILSEMVQHARVVTMNGKHPPKEMTFMFGHSIGWWEGDTLVVETTNFHPMHELYAHPLFHTETSVVTERFTRYADDQLLCEFTIEDPALYTQVWRGESRFNAFDEPIFEYACHEGNLSMPGILSGARRQERSSQSRP
ncbi:hypothetical protein F6455_13515 [Proteobacteria bacterium 005FR1]|nr:hypothetical protein [Proteobacteria bacterium 005FR1]